MKKIISLLLSLVMSSMCLPISVMALSGIDATAYNSAVYNSIINDLSQRGISNANYYLVDFDGDGNEELFLCYRKNDGYTNVEWCIEVHSGSNIIAQEAYTSYFFYNYNFVTNSDNPNKIYLVRSCLSGGAIVELDETITYTIENGEWKQIDKFNYNETGNPDSPVGHYQINGAAVSGGVYYAKKGKYNLNDVNALERYVVTGQEPPEKASLVNPSDWAVAELNEAEKAGLVPKLDRNPFMTESATRLQFAQLAVSLAEKATDKTLSVASDDTFADCDDAAVLKAYKAGIINGTSETKFSPYAMLTREQLATMIWRTVKYIQTATGKEKLTGGGDISGFADAYDVSDYAAEAVSALAKNEIMKGTSETELSPKGNCSVEQSIILIYRTYLKIK